MKNKLKLVLIAFCLMLTVCFGVKTTTSFVYASEDNFESFSNAFIDILKDDNIRIGGEISLDLEEDLFIQNNTYMISGDTFESKVGDDISIVSDEEICITRDTQKITLKTNENILRFNDSFEYIPEPLSINENSVSFPIEEVAESLGYELKFENNRIILSRPYITKRLIIKSYDKLNKCGAIKFAEGFNGLHIYQYSTEEETIEAYNYYRDLQNVQYVDVDSVVEICDKDLSVSGLEDSFSYSSWGAENMNVDDYSNYLLKSIGKNNLPEIVVAVLDTGLDSDHEWFNGRVVSGGKNFTSFTSTTSYEYEDVHGHGTHVAGTVVDLTLSNVKILPIKVMGDDGYGYTSSIISGMEYAISLKDQGLNIVALNMSLGGYSKVGSTDHDSYTTTINNAYTEGILTIAAAGNDGVDVSTHTPSNVTKAITVSAVGYSSNTYYKPTWSNYGTYVDVTAPGVGIGSACVGGGTVSKSGTSMAAPHVSAIVALLYSNSNNNYSPDDIEVLLDINAIDLGDAGWDSKFGEGLVNIEYAYAELIESVTFSNTDYNCTEPFELTITCNTSNANIYYTLDGTTPSLSNGYKYSSPITISTTTQVKAIAYVLDSLGNILAFSKIKAQTYMFYGEDVANAYTITSDGIITKYKGLLTNLIVPEKINNITVTAIGENAFTSSKVVIVSLPKTCLSINRNAFAGCTTIEEVYGESVSIIDMYAFSGCSKFKGFTDAHFPKLETIGKYAFTGCYKLDTINLTNLKEVDSYAFYMDTTGNSKLTSIVLPNVKVIEEMAFFNCNTVSSINMPSVEIIGADAFRECDIKNLDLPSLKYLGTRAFYVNESLLSVNMPEVLVIGDSAFYYYCTKLHTAYIPKAEIIGSAAFRDCEALVNLSMQNVVEIGDYTFENCSLTELNADKLKFIGKYAFRFVALEKINIPSIVSIRKRAFTSCEDLEVVRLSSCIEEIGKEVFSEQLDNCTFYIYSGTVAEDLVKNYNYTYIDLASGSSRFNYTIQDNTITINGYNGELSGELVIPSNISGIPVTKIGDSAFKNCENIYSINVAYLTEIGKSAFEGCINLTSIELCRIESIGNSAFENCNNLTNVNIENVSSVGSKAFYKCSKLLSVKIGDNIESVGEKAFGYSAEELLIPTFVIFGYEGSVLKTYAEDLEITFRAIFRNIEYFYYNIYKNNDVDEIYISFVDTRITGNVILPSSYNGMNITKIGSSAFENCCFITGVKLPDTIKVIDYRGFYGCTLLKEINLENVTSIGSYSFYNCEFLENLYIPKITTISNSAFDGCSKLKIVNAPILKTIGENAFSSNYSLLEVHATQLEVIQWSAFAYCDNLSYIDTMNLRVLGTIHDTGAITGAIFPYCEKLPSMLYLPKIETMGLAIFDASGVESVVIGKSFALYDSPSISSSIIIYGYRGYLAETYANKFGNTFIPIDEFAITKNLESSVDLYQGEDYSLNIGASGFGIKYEWFTTTSDTSNGVLINGVNLNSLEIDTSVVGTTKYYVKLTNWDNTTLVSKVSTINVVDSENVYIIQPEITGNGTITPSGSKAVIKGGSITISFSPSEGYRVSSIIVDNSPLTGETLTNAIADGYYTFENVTEDHNILVNFEIITFTITVIQTEHGVISSSLDSYEYGSSEKFTITSDAGYHVEYLLIDGAKYTQNLSEYLFSSIKQNHTISAVFAPNTDTKYTVKHLQEVVSGTTENYYNGKYYDYIESTIKTGTTGEKTQANVLSYDGYSLYYIEESQISGLGNTIVRVYYNRNQYTVNLTYQTGITYISGGGNYYYGDSVTVEADVDQYIWLGWANKDNPTEIISEDKVYTFAMPSRNLNLIATATKETFVIKVIEFYDSERNEKEYIVNYGENFLYNIEPRNGFKFSSIYYNGQEVLESIGDEFSISNVRDNAEIEIHYISEPYIITMQEYINDIALIGNIEVVPGSNYTLSFVPKVGYAVSNVIVDGVSYGAINEYSFSNVDSDHTVKVIYKLKKLSITVVCGENGTVSPSGVIEVDYGESITFNITPTPGYQISKITLNGTNINIDSIIVIDNVTADQILKVSFAKRFMIQTNCDNNGSISETKYILEGNDYRVEFTPKEGYRVKNVKVDNVDIGVVSSYTFYDVNRAHTIFVEYEIQTFSITIDIEGEGTVGNFENLEIINYGDDRTLVIYSEKGWKIDKIYVNNEEYELINNKLYIEDIKSNKEISIVFEKDFFEFGLNMGTLLFVFGGFILILPIIFAMHRRVKKDHKKF